MFGHLFFLTLCKKKQYSVIISLGFRQHLNLSLSPCFISLLFWSSQIVVSNRIFITSNQRFVKWHNHKIYELICCNIWERGLIDLHRVVIGPVCVLCAVCAEQHSCTTESIQTNVLWPFFLNISHSLLDMYDGLFQFPSTHIHRFILLLILH